MNLFSINDIIIDDKGFIGTVAYVGPICLSKKPIDWLGIIWQKANRGKNNGSLTDENGVHTYFKCQPNYGSFVQPSKVRKCKTICEALWLKYKVEGKESYNASEMIQIEDSNKKAKLIELVGMDEIAEIQQNSTLLTAELSYQDIVSVGNATEHYVSLTTLDLNHNHINSWDIVLSIIQSFPSLQSLILNANPVEKCEKCEKCVSFTSNLKTLAMSSTCLHLNDLIPYIACFPCLHSLYMSNNHMQNINIVGRSFPPTSLSVLDISSNFITEWNCIQSLSTIKSLTTLYIGDNALAQSQLEFDFPFIQYLDISHIGITTIVELNSILSHFTSLTELEIRGNEWYDNNSNARCYIIAEFPQLTKLNYACISKEEREESELSYLTEQFDKLLELNALSLLQWTTLAITRKEELLSSHLTLKRLLEKYGLPQLSLHKPNNETNCIKHNLISVFIEEESHGSNELICLHIANKIIKLPSTMKIKQVVLLLGKQFKLKPLFIKLYTYSEAHKVYMTDSMKSIADYGVEEGCVIGIDNCDTISLLHYECLLN